jgi:hypothetical protein
MLKTLLVTPLIGAFRLPRPVHPAPTIFKRIHLGFRKLEKERPIFIGIVIGMSVCFLAGAGSVRFFGTVRCSTTTQGSFPTGALADIVKMFGAVSIGLTPFANKDRTESIKR